MPSMVQLAAALILTLGLAACDAANTVTEGLQHTREVEKDLTDATGLKPTVGFNWSNGKLVQVTVTFPALYEGKPLREVTEMVRASVTKHFKQTPEKIVVGFTIAK